MAKRVEIISEKRVFDQHFKIDEAHLKFERFNGKMSDEITRLNFERGDSAAVVLHDPLADMVIMTEQFRYPTQTKGHPWILEIPAGSVESEEIDDPVKTLRRELLEEIGYRVDNFRKIASFFVSPGGTSERIHLFYAAIMPKDKIVAGGGVATEGEDIRIVTMGVQAALHKISTGEIMDAKTIIGLQWLQMNKGSL
ncbi:MAG: NUDIX hydrolase [Chloroflexi bacterium]|nr:NUDIX hydrolase [Chloroflexota bacterium]MCC6897046.1 NUDIX hydrolase [Anaerolineae bacterium]